MEDGQSISKTCYRSSPPLAGSSAYVDDDVTHGLHLCLGGTVVERTAEMAFELRGGLAIHHQLGLYGLEQLHTHVLRYQRGQHDPARLLRRKHRCVAQDVCVRQLRDDGEVLGAAPGHVRHDTPRDLAVDALEKGRAAREHRAGRCMQLLATTGDRRAWRVEQVGRSAAAQGCQGVDSL